MGVLKRVIDNGVVIGWIIDGAGFFSETAMAAHSKAGAPFIIQNSHKRAVELCARMFPTAQIVPATPEAVASLLMAGPFTMVLEPATGG